MLSKIIGIDPNNSCWIGFTEKYGIFLETITSLRSTRVFDPLAVRESSKEVEFTVQLAHDKMYPYHSFRALGLGKEERTAQEKLEKLNEILSRGMTGTFKINHAGLQAEGIHRVRTIQMGTTFDVYSPHKITVDFTVESVDVQDMNIAEHKAEQKKTQETTAVATNTKIISPNNPEDSPFNAPLPDTPLTEDVSLKEVTIDSELLKNLNNFAGMLLKLSGLD